MDTIAELTALSQRLSLRRSVILTQWRQRVQGDDTLAQASNLSLAQFYDDIPTLLDELERELRAKSSQAQRHVREDELKTSANHGVVRWQQGYQLVEVMREWRHLHLCLVEELELDGVSYTEMSQEGRAAARRIVARFFADGICASGAEYAVLQKTEAAGRVQDLERAITRLGELERERAEGWRETTHDLRGNLGILKNVTQVLDLPNVPETTRAQSLKILKRSVDWMHAFLNDLMTLARLEAGHEMRSVEPFDAGALLKDLCLSMHHLAEANSLFLVTEGTTPFSVEGDRVKVQRIAQNLLSNALTYTQKGGVKVTWGLDTTLGTDRWTLCVQDTGPGMDDGPVPPIAYALKDATDIENTKPDEKLVGQVPKTPPAATLASSSSTVRAHAAGEGVGLSIVKRLCELLEASLELQTEPGKGSTFRVTLPLRYPH